jgi:membrane-bound serine protease (ClpP class)
MSLVLKSRSWKSVTGKEEMIGEQGVVTVALPANGEGMIRVHGELWRAVSKANVNEGAKVRVLRVDGLKLEVEPVAVAVPSGN